MPKIFAVFNLVYSSILVNGISVYDNLQYRSKKLERPFHGRSEYRLDRIESGVRHGAARAAVGSVPLLYRFAACAHVYTEGRVGGSVDAHTRVVRSSAERWSSLLGRQDPFKEEGTDIR